MPEVDTVNLYGRDIWTSAQKRLLPDGSAVTLIPYVFARATGICLASETPHCCFNNQSLRDFFERKTKKRWREFLCFFIHHDLFMLIIIITIHTQSEEKTRHKENTKQKPTFLD
jgi:hypothetical protein